MKIAFWLPLYLFFVDISSISATEQIKNYGNQLRRERFKRGNIKFKRAVETEPKLQPKIEPKTDQKVEQKTEQKELQRKERQAIGTPAIDPTSDPSYDFAFRTPEYQRRENADALGRVRGLYAYVDDVGEKHLVRYAASADRGFEVFNSVPDASRYVQYSAPLYKTSPKARGRIAYERGPGRQYKFISAGPDQRRAESTGPDGVTRGAYSYLDDKGVQRTTQYIAGAGIGYRVVQATTGAGTHLLPRPATVEFGILYGRQPPNGGDGSNNGGSDVNGGTDDDNNNNNGGTGGIAGPNGPGGPSGPGGSAGGSGGFGADGFDGFGNVDTNSIDSDLPPFPDTDFDDPSKKDNQPGGGRNDFDFPKRGRGGETIIFNSGDGLFAIPPGASARAHVQNIDLRPFKEDAALSPSEALRRDERRFLRLRFRG